jgi:CheY-like chemotaxis protein
MVANMNPAPTAAPGKILVIDDNPIIQRAVYFALRDKGYKVFMSGDITEALNVVRKERPELILLDINFPAEFSVGGVERDGFWALGWMQRMDEMKNVPIIMISSDEAAKSEARALAAGAAAYLQKPINKDDLAAKIAGLLAAAKSAV